MRRQWRSLRLYDRTPVQSCAARRFCIRSLRRWEDFDSWWLWTVFRARYRQRSEYRFTRSKFSGGAQHDPAPATQLSVYWQRRLWIDIQPKQQSVHARPLPPCSSCRVGVSSRRDWNSDPCNLAVRTTVEFRRAERTETRRGCQRRLRRQQRNPPDD